MLSVAMVMGYKCIILCTLDIVAHHVYTAYCICIILCMLDIVAYHVYTAYCICIILCMLDIAQP